jgi:hypothetical protein
MDDLIAALLIFKKYSTGEYTSEYPIQCEHDVMHVNIEYSSVSDEDKQRLEELDFIEDKYGTFMSYRFGSC